MAFDPRKIDETCTDLYRKHRPRRLKDVVGQDDAISQLSQMLKAGYPHTTMLCGPPGTGKNTIGRILSEKLGCGDGDYREVDCALVDSAIDTVRGICQQVGLSPMTGKCRIWLFDEIQAFSKTPFAQQAMLKMLEECNDWVYFFLCTTNPEKVHDAIRTRCAMITLKSVSAIDLETLVKDVAEREKAVVPVSVLKAIAGTARGSPRRAIVQLQQVIGVEGEENQLRAIQDKDEEKKAYDLVKALLWERKKWSEIVKLLETVDVADMEDFRHLVLTCCAKEMRRGGASAEKGYQIAGAFERPWFDCKETGLMVACWEVTKNKD